MKRGDLVACVLSLLLYSCSTSNTAELVRCPCAKDFYCDLPSDTCQPGCIDNLQCSAGKLCDLQARQCVPGCLQDSDCGDSAQICDASNKMCRIGCRQDNQCTTAGQICDAATLLCRAGCRQDNQCTIPGQICDAASFSCRAGCRHEINCGAGQGCSTTSYTCQPKCAMDSQCATGEICDPLSSICRAGCRTNPACSGGKTCDTVGLVCVSPCSQDSNCAAGEICDPVRAYCRAGCRQDPNCPTGQRCDLAKLQCRVQCTQDMDCPLGQSCDMSSMLCRPAPGFPGCVGRQCDVQLGCPSFAGPTTLTGTVSTPAGNLPLPKVKVFIPSSGNGVVPTTGPSCELCANAIPADAAAKTTTKIDGSFTLTNVPSGTNIPMVIRIGKWQRTVIIPNVSECTTTALSAPETRLPRNQSEGHIPKIALSTGVADAMECLLRPSKLGLDDSEFTNPTGNGRVNLYTGNNSVGMVPTRSYSVALGGATFPDATTWWNTAAEWDRYDLVLLSCEGGQFATQKTAAAHTALQGYIDKGGRVLSSHWHNIWIAGASNAVNTVATFVATGGYQNDTTAILANINQSFANGMDMANWLMLAAVGGSTQLGKLSIEHSRQTVTARSTSLSQSWVDFQPIGFTNQSQYFSFPAPVGAAPSLQCGKMSFTDMHVSGGVGDVSSSAQPFPSGCTTTGLTPQEKALLYWIFELGDCL